MNLLTIEKDITESRTKNTCRYCKSTDLERIHRGRVARYVFFWLPLRYFVCYKCLRKHYKL